MATLALCVMTKNEEQYLPYCIASVSKFVDEIVVVDTGSSDKTVEIAKAFGAYVIHAPWRDDFALIRNVLQSPVKSDWILWLDGDEVLSEAGIRKVKQLITDDSIDFLAMPRANFWKHTGQIFLPPDTQWKCYRNNVGLKWSGKIHEIIYNEHNPDHRRKAKQTDVMIFHYAYMKTSEEVKKKMALYIHIENPNMEMGKIDRCSTEHSFFFNKPTEGVVPYHGPLPEIMDRLEVTNQEIKWRGGSTIYKFGSMKIIQPVLTPIAKVSESAPVLYNGKKWNSEYQKDLVSIVIATFNKIEYVRPCVNGIYDSTKQPFEIIVVDNGSTEMNVMQYLTEMAKLHDNFKYVHSDKNLGFAGGYNKGIEASRGEWICVLNNDTLPTSGWIAKMIHHMKNDPKIGIIGPVSNNIHGEHQLLNLGANADFGAHILWVEKQMEQGKPSVLESSWLTGCCMLFKRELLDELAKIESPPREGTLFDERFLIGQAEDTDLDFYVQHRLHKKLAVARNVMLWHHGQKTLEAVGDWQKIQEDNNKILRKKWPEIFPNG